MENATSRASWPLLSGAALAVIAAYQRWLSPRKGFACAHRVRHGGTGCSGYAKQAIRARGLRAWPDIRARFAACRAAAMAIATEDEREQDKSTRRSKTDRCDDALDLSFFGCESLYCLGSAGRAVGGAGRALRPGPGDCAGPCDLFS